MTRMCAVSFARSGKLYYFDPGPYEPRIGDQVLVPTDAGPEVAECVWAGQEVTEPVSGLPVLVGMATAGVAPRIMGFGPTPATLKVLAQTGLTIDHMDVIELNEAFAAQGLAVLRALGLNDDDARVNAWGGAIALGHPLGASGARLVTTAVNRLHEHAGKYALCTMCIGVGQGIAVILERV